MNFVCVCVCVVFFQLGQLASACDPTTLEAAAQVADTQQVPVSTKIAVFYRSLGPLLRLVCVAQLQAVLIILQP